MIHLTKHMILGRRITSGTTSKNLEIYKILGKKELDKSQNGFLNRRLQVRILPGVVNPAERKPWKFTSRDFFVHRE